MKLKKSTEVRAKVTQKYFVTLAHNGRRLCLASAIGIAQSAQFFANLCNGWYTMAVLN